MIRRFLTFFLAILIFCTSPVFAQTVQKIKNLHESGVEAFKANDYTSAETYFTQCLDTISANDGINNELYLQVYSQLCDIYYKTKQFNRTVTAIQKYFAIYRNLYEEYRDVDNCEDILFVMEKSYAALHDYANAILYCDTLLSLVKSHYGETSLYYCNIQGHKAEYLSELGKYDSSIVIRKSIAQTLETVKGNPSYEYAIALGNIAQTYSHADLWDSATNAMYNAIKIYEATESVDSATLAIFLNNLALYEKMAGRYNNAINILQQALSIKSKTSGVNSINYAYSVLILADVYCNLYNYYESIKLYNSVLDILQEDDYAYLNLINNLAIAYSQIGDNEKAIQLTEESLKLRKQKNKSYAIGLQNLALQHLELDEFDQALKYVDDALDILNALPQEENFLKSKVLGTKATIERAMGDIELALKIEEDAIKYGKMVPNNTSLMSRYNEFIVFSNDLRLFNNHVKQYADTLLLQSKKIYGDTSALYAEALINVAKTYNLKEKYDLADSMRLEAISIIERNLGKNHEWYPLAFGNLAYSHAEQGKTDACMLLKHSIDLYTSSIGLQKMKYYTFVKNAMRFMFNCSKQDVYQQIPAFTNNAQQYMQNAFKILTTSQRSTIWNTYMKDYFDNYLPFYVYSNPVDSIVECGLNGILFSKGLLLNSDISLKEMIMHTGDSNLIFQYDKLRLVRLQLNKLYDLPVEKRFCPVDSLEKFADNLERHIIAKCKEYSDFTKNLNIQWNEVKYALNSNEAAVEFVSFQSGDTTIYAAYIIRQDLKYPQWIILYKTKTDITKRSQKALFSQELSKAIWEKLSNSTMHEAKTIYFAPTGELYNIPIESLPDFEDSTHLISDRWNLYRLSSTRELALNKDKYKVEKGAVYGGLRYDMDTIQLYRDNERYPHTRQRSYMGISELNLRDDAAYLPGTYTESLLIDTILQSAHINNKLYMDTLGTEASFKALSGQKINLLHISTHGFYWTLDETDRTPKSMSFIMDDNLLGKRYEEDKMLTRSGLILAGANSTLQNNIYLSEEMENGVLTAKEIANLDLHGLDMVVLSACQTGLGDVSSEGVFGLQRGFKKAGANSIIMSLWKVDDIATQILMSQFYTNWLIKKMTKQQALKKAQEYIRNFEVDEIEWTIALRKQRNEQRGGGGNFRSKATTSKSSKSRDTSRMIKPYQDPKYWTAFILLDGLD